jgi:hypothetical protein
MRSKKVTSKAMMGEIRSLAMISGGMILGTIGGKAIDKMLKVDNSLPGFQAKKFVRPISLLGAGILGSIKLQNTDLKMLSAGVGASGVVSTVKVVLKKDLLSGMDGVGNPMTVYQDPMVHAIESYEPNLPALTAGNYIPEENYTESYSPGQVVTDYNDAEIEII